MKKILWLSFFFVIVSCSESKMDVTTGLYEKKVIINTKKIESDIRDDGKDCNKIFVKSFRMVRVGQELLYKNESTEIIFVDISDQPGEEGLTKINYEIEPMASAKIKLPFFGGELMSVFYVKINDSDWLRMCPFPDNVNKK